MEDLWKAALWQQFGAAIEVVARAVDACPDDLWRARVWDDPYAEFWNVACHTLFWADLYLSGAVAGFSPSPPFTLDELDPAGRLPDRAYTRAEVRAYLAHTREKARATIDALTDERARTICTFSWGRMSFLELLLYTMRHTQEHGSNLGLALGQHGVAAPDWVPWAGDRRDQA